MDINRRAGTHLDHRFTSTIRANGQDHGIYDAKQRVFQSGGELSDFVFWKKKSITMSVGTWLATRDALLIEFIDHGKNVCYRISRTKAEGHAERYTAGAGSRVAIPLVLWDQINAAGDVISQGV
jgi:hypothetical protein